MKKKNLSGLFSILLLLTLFIFTLDARSQEDAGINDCMTETDDGLHVDYDCLAEMGIDENTDVRDLVKEALSEED